MTVLILIVGMLAQVVQNTTTSIQRSTKGMDTNQMATTALDRIGSSVANMVAYGQGTLVAVKNGGGSDGLAMITNGRVRSRTSVGSISVNDSSNVRMGARGYCVIPVTDPDLMVAGGTHPLVPMLNWGDGTVDWDGKATTSVQGDPLQALSLGVADVVKIMGGGTTSDAKMLQFDPLSRSIFRLEVSFLLSNGTLVSTTTPPLNKHFVSVAAGGDAPTAPVTWDPTSGNNISQFPLAFKAADVHVAPVSSTPGPTPLPTPVFVRAVVVGIASLDNATLKILSANQLTKLGDISVLAKATDGQTPLQAWDISNNYTTTYQNLSSSGGYGYPLPVIQNIRFSQRYFYVN